MIFNDLYREVMVIVQTAKSSSTPSENLKTGDLKSYEENMNNPYVTAYLKADVLPLTFVVGDGKEYNSEKENYFNQPLKLSSSYIVFLRFFESQVNISKRSVGLLVEKIKYHDNYIFVYRARTTRQHGVAMLEH